MFDIKRIEKMEEKLDRCTSAVRALDAALADYADISADIGELADYLSSSEWREDFEADESGKLPADLKRGVLSEDGVYHLLEENKEILGMMRAVLGE